MGNIKMGLTIEEAAECLSLIHILIEDDEIKSFRFK